MASALGLDWGRDPGTRTPVECRRGPVRGPNCAPIGLQGEPERELLPAPRNAVPFRRSDVSQAFVQVLRGLHRRARPQHDGRVAPPSGVSRAVLHQGCGDAGATTRLLDSQPEDLRLLGASDGGEICAVRDESNSADHPLLVCGNEEVTSRRHCADIGFAPWRSRDPLLANEHVGPQMGNLRSVCFLRGPNHRAAVRWIPAVALPCAPARSARRYQAC
jgi:hypothetical protein